MFLKQFVEAFLFVSVLSSAPLPSFSLSNFFPVSNFVRDGL